MINGFDSSNLWISGLTIICLLSLFGIIMIWYQKAPDIVRMIFKSYIIFFLGIISVPIGIILVVLNRNGIISAPASLYFLSFAVFLTWLLIGNNYLFNQVIHLPDNRQLFVRRFNLLMIGIYIITIVGILRSLNLFDFLIEYNPNEENLMFMFISIVSLLLFAFFRKALGKEMEQNSSKLIQMRLALTRYFIFAQMITIVLIFFLSITLFFVSETRVPLFRAILNFFFNSAALGSGIILVCSVVLPDFIRQRYDLSQRRFRRFRLLSQS